MSTSNDVFKGLVKFEAYKLVWIVCYKLSQVLIVACFIFSNLFTYDSYNDKMLEDSNFIKRGALKEYRNLRFNLRVVIGTFIPINKNFYKNLSDEERAALPNPENAIFGINYVQYAGIYLMSEEVPMLQDATIRLVWAIKEVYKESQISDLNWNLAEGTNLKEAADKKKQKRGISSVNVDKKDHYNISKKEMEEGIMKGITVIPTETPSEIETDYGDKTQTEIDPEKLTTSQEEITEE